MKPSRTMHTSLDTMTPEMRRLVRATLMEAARLAADPALPKATVFLIQEAARTTAPDCDHCGQRTQGTVTRLADEAWQVDHPNGLNHATPELRVKVLTEAAARLGAQP